MTTKNIGIAVSLLIAAFSASMVVYNYILHDYEMMAAYVIAFTGWILAMLGEAERKS